jgi:diguanylate cyclase (GGDEF)-like protein
VLDDHGALSNYNSTFTRILNNTETNEDFTTNDSFKRLLGQQDEFALLIKQALGSYHLESHDFPLIEAGRAAPRWMHCLLSKMIDSSGDVVLEGVIFDVTERVHNEEMIKREAHYDHLTGMLHRKPAKMQFESYLANNPSANACFLLLDLDGFKHINDSYGHPAGDQVLTIVAERLFKCVRVSDVVCRLGGDEFVIILMNDQEANLKSEVANKILASISQPISLDTGELVSVGVSMGITDIQLSKSKNFEVLIKDADKAMYQVKNDGKNNYQIKA